MEARVDQALFTHCGVLEVSHAVTRMDTVPRQSGATHAASRPVHRIDQPAPLVKRFLDHLFLECGLAGLTVTAYQHDLGEFWKHLTAREVEPGEITMEDVQQHLIHLQRRGLAVASIAPVTSLPLRSFYDTCTPSMF